MYSNCTPDDLEYEKIKKELQVEALNLRHLHRIFGQAFFELLVLCLLDARTSGIEIGELIEQMKNIKK